MTKSHIILGGIVLVGVLVIGSKISSSGLEGRFMRETESPGNYRDTNRRDTDTRSNTENLSMIDGRAYQDAEETKEAQNSEFVQDPQVNYVTLSDLSIEIVKRKLNITSGWGGTTKAYPSIDLDKGPQPLKDCVNGLIDSEWELGEWQYCYLHANGLTVIKPYDNINLKGKITEEQAAKLITKSFYYDHPSIGGTSEALSIKNAVGIEYPFSQEFLTSEKAKTWFEFLNKTLEGKKLWNAWGMKGDLD